MQKTATLPIDLVALERLCQQQLQERFPQMTPLQAHCYLRDETLVLTVEHHPPVLAYPHQAFRLFEQLLEDSQPEVAFTGLIYLRMQGQQQPYAFHIAKVKPPELEVEEEENPPAAAVEAALFDDFELAEPEATVEPEATAEPDVSPDSETATSRSEQWLPMAGIAAGFGLVVFGLSVYFLSRPCVLGGCRELAFARELAEKSIEMGDAPPSGETVLIARRQFDRSLRILKSIPPWSGHRQEAQALLAEYEETGEEFDTIVAAMQTAVRAGKLTQNPPLAVEKWERARAAWQEAIAPLQRIPANSEFDEIVPRKLAEYKKNLASVEARLKEERDALENLTAARDLAKTAKVREDLAENFEQLERAGTMWAQVARRLESIPTTTTVYPQARKTLRTYLPQISATRNRRDRETEAKDTIAKAETFAKNAKASENANQWSAAVINWRDAIATVEKISDKSFSETRAKTLVKTYRTELGQAEAMLRNAMKLQQIRKDLAQLCSTPEAKVCEFTVDKKKIQVYLSPSYVYRVRTSAQNAQNKRDEKTQVQLLEHVYAVERALNAISDSAGLPLAVYNGSTLVQTHEPEDVKAEN